MKTSMTLTTVFAALLALSSFSFAEGDCQGKRADKHMDRLTEKLELSDEQASAVSTIFENQRSAMQTLKDETQQQLSDILTEEQLEKFNNMRHRRGPHKRSS